MKNNILIITGGTGGHVIPALNFFNYINKQLDNIFIITDYRGTKYIKNINNKKIFQIQSSHLAGNILFKLKAIVKLFIGFIQSIYIFIKIRPNVIISFGSYASVTPLICFYVFKFFFKTKLYIHEQNSVIGQTNKLFAKIANKIFVNYNIQYPSIKKYKSKIVVAGLPQKINFNYLNNKKNNSSNFNFLVFAGSQGSVDILEIFSKIIDKFDNNISVIKTIKFIVQSPKEKQNEIKQLLIKKKYNFEIKSFFDNFDNILCNTDIVLCRAGAGTINDLINYKIPAIICPLPSAKDNHQYENAKILTSIKSAIIINKNKIDFDKVFSFINKVIDDKNFNKKLIDNYSKINRYNSNKLMWAIIKNDQNK